MVRTRVRTFVAVLGVLIAFAMTPRTALAVTLDRFPSEPIVSYSVGNAPTLLTPDEVLSGLSRASNVYPDTSFSQIFGGYSEYFDGSIRNNTGSTATTSGSSQTYDNTVPLTRTYDYVIGNFSASNIPSDSTVYFDFYFVAPDWLTFPSSLEYSVVPPSLVQPVVFRNSNVSGSPSSWFDFVPVSSFVLDSVQYYRDRIVNQQSVKQWVVSSRTGNSSMVYPFHAQGSSGTIGLRGFVVRGHMTMPSYSTISGYDYSLFFGIDNLALRVALYDSDVMATINGSSSQESTGVPVTTTITNSTHQQTDTLMDTTGSGDIVSGLTGGGYDGFVSRFGFIAQTAQYVLDFYGAITNVTSASGVPFPGITVLGVELVPAQTVYAHTNGLRAIISDSVKPVLTGIACISWIFWVYNDFRRQFLGIVEEEA